MPTPTILQQVTNKMAELSNTQRPGQILYNYVLPLRAVEPLTHTVIDPYPIATLTELALWIDHHLILSDDCSTVLAVFSNNEILWEAN